MSDQTAPLGDPELISLLDQYRGENGPPETSNLARGLHDCGLVLLRQAYLAQAEACLTQARELALSQGSTALVARTTLDLARSFHERWPKRALSLLASLDVSELHAKERPIFLNTIALSLDTIGSYESANKLYLLMDDLARQQNDRTALATSLANRASIVFEHGSHDEARKINADALAILLDSGEVNYAGLVLSNMATNAMHEGKYDESLLLYERADKIRNDSCHLRLHGHTMINRAECELLTGSIDSAYELFRIGEQHAKAIPSPSLQVEALIFRSTLEQGLTDAELLEAAVAAAHDLHTREIFREAGPIAALAAGVSSLTGKDCDHLSSVLSDIRLTDVHVRLLLQHYKRIFSALAESRRNQREQAFPRFISRAPSVIGMKHQLEKLVNTEVRILLEGESGTGKSFLARQIHEASRNHRASFVVVDCTNLEENLFESKLFGHLRGSFTGAVSDTVGLVEQANGGTLFLDEIGELPTEIQGKLLYTVEEQRYRPVGAKAERRSEFRVIAATNRNIDQMLENGTLRSDLFFRLAGFRATLPPLRQRREDIMPLADLQLDRLNRKYGRRKSLRHEIWEGLVTYSWPGNVRELNATIERGYHLSADRRISLDDLGVGLSPDSRDLLDLSWYAVRREHLLRVLRICRGNVSRTAQILGLNRTTLIYKLKLLNIARRDFDSSCQIPSETTQ